MINQLIANITSVFSIDIAAKYGIGVTDTFMYANLMTLLLCPVYGFIFWKLWGINIFNFKMYRKNKKLMLLLLPSIFSAFTKAYLVSGVSQATVKLYSTFCPFLVIIASAFIFKDKIHNKYFKYCFAIATIGFLIGRYNTISMSFGLTIGFIIYIFLNTGADLCKRKVGITRGFEGAVLDIVLYIPFGIISFVLVEYDLPSLVDHKFSIQNLFSPVVLIVAILSGLQHLFTVIAFTKAKNMYQIVFVDFFKIVIVAVSSYIFFDKLPALQVIIGTIIMSLSIVIYRYMK